MTNGYLTGTLTVFGTALSIKMEPNYANGYETICVDTKPNDNDPSLKETEPSKAIFDLAGYQLAIEGCILPPLAANRWNLSRDSNAPPKNKDNRRDG